MTRMSPQSPAEPRKTPRQARAIATCAAIVEAAARILETGGPESLNTNAIAEIAGVSIGTLYQYYPDKQAVLVALIRRERAMLLEELHAIPVGDPQALEAMVAASIRHQFARPRLAAALESIETTLSLDAEAARMAEDIARLSGDLLAARFGPLDPDDRLTAVLIARAIVNGAGDGLLPHEGLPGRVLAAITGYLEAVRL